MSTKKSLNKKHLLASALMAAGLTTGAAWAQNTEGGLFEVIRPAESVNLGMVELGKKLYFDPRLQARVQNGLQERQDRYRSGHRSNCRIRENARYTEFSI